MNEVMTPQQLADRLQVGVTWVYEQTRTRASARNADPLPYIQMGRYLRFDWTDVVAWLERQKHGAKFYDASPAREAARVRI